AAGERGEPRPGTAGTGPNPAAALPLMLAGRTREHAAPHRPRPGLRQADPQDQPPGQLTRRRTRTAGARPGRRWSQRPVAVTEGAHSIPGQQLTPGIREGSCHMKALVVDKYGKDSTLRAQQMPEPEIGD